MNPKGSSDWALCATIDPEQPEAVIPIDHDRFVIGRDPGLDLTLESQFVSARHVELSSRGGRLFVLDLSSRNGVLINEKRIRRCEVGLGDMIRVADVNFRVDRLTNVQGGANAVTRWVSSQFPKLFAEHSVTTVLDPIFDLEAEAIIGCQAVMQSRVSGLETVARMCAAARTQNRECDLARLCMRQYAEVARFMPDGSEVYLSTPLSQNLPVVLIPALRDWKDHFTGCRPIVEIHHAVHRTLSSLQNFQREIDELGIDFALASFGVADLEVVRKSNIKPTSVVLDRGLTAGISEKTDVEQRRLRTLMDLLSYHGITARVINVTSDADLDLCREMGVTLAQGPHLGQPRLLPSKLPRETYAFTLPPTERDESEVTARLSPSLGHSSDAMY